MTDSSSIDKQLMNDAMQLAKNRAAWVADRERLLPIIGKFEEMGGEAQWYSNGLTLRLTGGKEALTKAIRLLRTAGGTTESAKPQPGETSYSGLYHFEGLTSKYVFLYFTSSVCRRVQIGTVMKEMPVYEVVCDEGDLPTEGETNEVPF